MNDPQNPSKTEIGGPLSEENSISFNNYCVSPFTLIGYNSPGENIIVNVQIPSKTLEAQDGSTIFSCTIATADYADGYTMNCTWLYTDVNTNNQYSWGIQIVNPAQQFGIGFRPYYQVLQPIVGNILPDNATWTPSGGNTNQQTIMIIPVTGQEPISITITPTSEHMSLSLNIDIAQKA